MSPDELRRLVGKKPYNQNTGQSPEVIFFMREISERSQSKGWGRYAWQVVEDMTDDELMARWARHQLEKEE